MLEAIGDIPWDSLATLSSPRILFLLLLGVTGGLAVGVTPGLGPTIAVALLIPVTFTMPPDEAFAVLTAVYVGGMSGGALTAILLRLPGTPASMATVLDGFPLAQRGEAGRAIGNAIVNAIHVSSPTTNADRPDRILSLINDASKCLHDRFPSTTVWCCAHAGRDGFEHILCAGFRRQQG